MSCNICNVLMSFNPRARRGRDNLQTSAISFILRFNPRARRGRDTSFWFNSISECQFQSTRPQGARLTNVSLSTGLAAFQSTRPQGARPRTRKRKPTLARVSIHAPAGGATQVSNICYFCIRFQSTRPQGARPFGSREAGAAPRFNPRARRGRDMILLFFISGSQCFNPRARRGRDLLPWLYFLSLLVSIHAPAGGATPAVPQLGD